MQTSTNTFFGQVENCTPFFSHKSYFRSSMFNPILYIHPINIERIHQDLSFKACQIADNKLD